MWLVCVMPISGVIGHLRVQLLGIKISNFSNKVMRYIIRRVLTSTLRICMILVCGMLTWGVIGCFEVVLWAI